MNTLHKLLKCSVIGALIAVLFAVALPTETASASTQKTTTVTEAQINESYRITNPIRRPVGDKSVDLRPGQAVVSETVSTRAGKTYAVIATYSISVFGSRVSATLLSATVDGQPASQEVIDLLNAQVKYPLIRAFNHAMAARITSPYKVTAVTVSDVDMIVNYTTLR